MVRQAVPKFLLLVSFFGRIHSREVIRIYEPENEAL